jgi:hypothetical protein
LPKLPREDWGRPMRLASKVELRKGVWAGVVLCPKELSRDILFLVFEAAAPGKANSPSYMGFGRGVFETRWDNVDFLSEVVLRSGVCAELMGEEKENAFESLYTRSDSSVEVRGAGIGSKMLSKSTPRLDAPCTLRRLAIGLLPFPPLKFIRPSLRLSGLDFAGGAGDKSGRDCANANLIGLSLTGRSSVSMHSGDSATGRRGVFSWPCVWRVMKGVEFPTSVESPRGRRGLFDLLVRVRGDERKGAERRSENLLAAGAAWVASGDSGYIAVGLVGLCGLGLKARASPSGERGERGESVVRSWKREGLEGERESERRSCWR